MEKKLKGLFWTIEINVLLWLVVCVSILQSKGVETGTKQLTAAGFIFAAILQHWAYYNLYKATGKENNSQPRV